MRASMLLVLAGLSLAPAGALAETVNLPMSAITEFRTGYMYERGTGGVAQDYAQAMQHYLAAAAQGNAVAEFRIGYLYEHGWGVPQDFKQATQWYEKAAAHGNQQAATRSENLKSRATGP